MNKSLISKMVYPVVMTLSSIWASYYAMWFILYANAFRRLNDNNIHVDLESINLNFAILSVLMIIMMMGLGFYMVKLNFKKKSRLINIGLFVFITLSCLLIQPTKTVDNLFTEISNGLIEKNN